MKRSLKFILLALIISLILGGGGFLVWASTPLGPTPEALDSLKNTADVQINQDSWLVFTPTGVTLPEAGLVLYPGGRVDARSYAPLAHKIARAGFLVVIAPMPLNLAVFNPNAANAIFTQFPEIKAWAIGGHSLGGAMAARYAYQNPASVQGLALWAAYPASTDDLSGNDLQVVSIYGTLDGLADPQTIKSASALLPTTATWVAIEGGNHAQFGSYGTQAGDNLPAISATEQQDAIVNATIDLLNQIAQSYSRQD